MEHNRYPKVLIIGQSFNKSGGGITISNLFYGWPKDRLAVASADNLQSGLDTSVCEVYYQIGYNGKLHPFPLNLILPGVKIGIIDPEQKDKSSQSGGEASSAGRYRRIYSALSLVLKFLGIYNFLYKLKITPELKDWIAEYNPDIIYSQLSTLELIVLVSEIRDLTTKPVVLHIMDDWPVSINKPGLMLFYWKKVINREFRKLMEKSSVLMSICESMSEEYKTRYNKNFIPFHNPVVVEDWLPFSKTKWEIIGKFRILYTGRVGKANGKAIMFMANVINDLNINGSRIELDVFTPDINTSKAVSMSKLRGVQIKKVVPHEKMPSLLSSYDLLFLPLDFDEEGIRFAQFSMPTKTSEYMISGTPILVFADLKTALAKYALEGRWAYTVTDNNKEALIKALGELSSDISLRIDLALKAKTLAVHNEDAISVRENFRKKLLTDSSSFYRNDSVKPEHIY